ncbi:MAG: hypothetical protein P1U63_12590 [Coxiellaceae bacterium]|nr:hypothetical protein [Coxiellaceae bacterium]
MIKREVLVDLIKKAGEKLQDARGATAENLPESILLRPPEVIISHVLYQLETLQLRAPDSQAIDILQTLIISCMQAGSTAAGDWLLQHRNSLSPNTITAFYSLSAEGNQTATQILGLLAEQNTAEAGHLLFPSRLAHHYYHKAVGVKDHWWQLVPRRFIWACYLKNDSENIFFSAEELDELRAMHWHKEARRKGKRRFDDLSNRINQLLSDENTDNRYTLHELSLLHASTNQRDNEIYEHIIRELSKHTQAIDIMITAGNHHHYKIVHDLAVKLKTNNNTLRVTRSLYYQNPTNRDCIAAYYKCLNEHSSNTAGSAEAKKIQALIPIGIDHKVDNITFEHVFKRRCQEKGAFEVMQQKETLQILRDPEQSTALKQRIFHFLQSKEHDLYYLFTTNKLMAQCYEEGLGCTPDPAKARQYREHAARLGHIISYDKTYPTLQHPDSLLIKARNGYRAALLKLQKHVDDHDPSYEHLTAARQCLIDCYALGYSCAPDYKKAEALHQQYPDCRKPSPLYKHHDPTPTFKYELTYTINRRHEALQQAFRPKLIKSEFTNFLLMAIGASNKSYQLMGSQHIAKGHVQSFSQLNYADLSRTYIENCSDSATAIQWKKIVDNSNWCLNYFKAIPEIADTDTAAWGRLKQGLPINISVNWYADSSGHAMQLVFFKYQNQYYLAKSNRGARGPGEKSGTTLYHIGNIDCLKNRGVTNELIEKCKQRQYCDGMSTRTVDTMGHDLQLTAIKDGHFKQTSQKGGTCALSSVQNCYRTLLAVSHLHEQTDHIESKADDGLGAINLTGDKFIRAFETSTDNYKTWRAAMRVLSVEQLATAGKPDDPCYLRPTEHLPILQHVINYLLNKCDRTNERSESVYRLCKDSITAIKACLFTAKSPYTAEQKQALQREMNLVTAKIESLTDTHSATTASTSSTSSPSSA